MLPSGSAQTVHAVRERHARYVARTIGELTLRTLGPDEERVVQRLNEYLPDAVVALDWCIDHREWDTGIPVIWAGRRVNERACVDMASLLLDSARAEGGPENLLDELELMDPRGALVSSMAERSERAWRRIRSPHPIPSDRYMVPPYVEIRVTAAQGAPGLVTARAIG